MAKYYLNVNFNDEYMSTITKGNLSEIDNYIINNNIYNVNQLYEHIKNNFKEELEDDKISFEIVYKYNKQIYSVPLFFKKELSDFKSPGNDAEYIYKKLKDDKYLKYNFDKKFINSLACLPPEIPIGKKAVVYLYKPNFEDFNELYWSLIKKTDSKTDKVTYDYKKQREMYFYVKYFSKSLPKTELIINNQEKIDEFDEQMMYDPFPDSYRINGKRIEDINEEAIDNDVKTTISKPKVKRLKKFYVNPDQISWFDNK